MNIENVNLLVMTFDLNRFTLIVILFLVTFIVSFLSRRAIVKFSILKSIEANRRKVIVLLCYGAYYFIAILIALPIIGANLKDFAIFAASVLTVIGVALFAQWSLLSNLTAAVILFFFHPIRIGSRIKIVDKEMDFEAVVEDITGFYTILKKDNTQIITIPNSVILYKGIEFLDN